MILGFGTDLCDIRRIEAALAKYGERFTRRVFAVSERMRAERAPHARPASYAKRFAAKEACAKALGTGFRDGIFLSDIRVINDQAGRPILDLHGAARARLEALVPLGCRARLFLSMTDEYPYAQAQVIISAEPLGGP